jgi:hypothetical protein
MSNATDPSKRIPKSLGTDTQLLGQYSLTDLLVAGMPGVVVILVTQVVLPTGLEVAGVPVSTLTIPVAILGIGVGALFVYLTPGYTTSLDWLEQFVGFYQSEKELPHEAAKEYTQVERVLPDRDAIVRTDGALVGAIHVDPPTMALATDEEWRTKAEAFQDFVNTTVDFPVQLYSTTQSFPADEYLDAYESRLSDPDVKENPKLAALVENYVEWYEDELTRRQMTIRDHYVVVPVTPREVRFERDGLAEKFADLRVVETLVQAATSPPVAEERAVMADELDERLKRVERGLRGIEDVNAARIDVVELTGVIDEFWAGEDLEHGDLPHRIRTTPIVNGGEA